MATRQSTSLEVHSMTKSRFEIRNDQGRRVQSTRPRRQSRRTSMRVSFVPARPALCRQLLCARFLAELFQTPTRSRAQSETQLQSKQSPSVRSSLEFRGTEKSAWRFARLPNRRQRTRLPPCKRCAALARRRSCANSFQPLKKLISARVRPRFCQTWDCRAAVSTVGEI